MEADALNIEVQKQIVEGRQMMIESRSSRGLRKVSALEVRAAVG